MDLPYTPPPDTSLLNDWQRDFSIVTHPFAQVTLSGADEMEVLATVQRLQARGAISRVGAVFAPRRVGASTLAALAAPDDQVPIERIARRWSARGLKVNHNYQRANTATTSGSSPPQPTRWRSTAHWR